MPDMSKDLAIVVPTVLIGTYEADLEVGAKIREAAESLQFMLGDWVNGMQDKYGETQLGLSRDLSAKTGVPANTLREYARVSRTFAPAKRLADASWSQHQAAAESAQPVTTLRTALKDGLSVRDTKRLAKGLPVGGEDVAQKESSITASGASLEEAVLASIVLAEEHLTRALATMGKPGFRLTVNVGQDIMAKLEAASKPFVSIEAAVKDEVGALL